MKLKLHWWILLGMLVGAAMGGLLHSAAGPDYAPDTAWYALFHGISRIFLKLLKMIVIPLVFFSLLGGLLGMGNITQLGRLGIKTFSFYLGTSFVAAVSGLLLVNLLRPGVGVDIAIPTEAVDKELPSSVWDQLVSMIPDNPVASAARFDLLGVIIFALFFGSFMLTLESERRRTLVSFVDGASEVMMRMTGFIISLAPIGVGALIARLVASTGFGVFWEMRWYVVTVFVGLALHTFVTMPFILFLVRKKNPYRFLRAMSPALLTGFSTASSSGTLGVTMERAEHGAGVSNRVASFVLPIGATINMDGTALYEIVSVLFIAQLHAGIDPNFSLTIGQQILIVLLGLAVSVGAAGIPHAGLVMMVVIVQAVGLPIEYTALIWSVDRVLDMCRTATNIAGDATITMIVAHLEGEVDESVLQGS